MEYNTKIRNQNFGCFVVKKRVFSSLYDAEVYCDKNGLDVNNDIVSETSESIETAYEISKIVLSILYEIKEKLHNTTEIQRGKASKFTSEYKDSLTRRDLSRELKKEYMDEQIGLLKGLGITRDVIAKYIENHEKILNRSLTIG